MHLLYKLHACVLLHMYAIHVLLCLHLALWNRKYVCCFHEACFIWKWMSMKRGWIGKMAQWLHLLNFLVNQSKELKNLKYCQFTACKAYILPFQFMEISTLFDLFVVLEALVVSEMFSNRVRFSRPSWL
jgi:hypothetical protein